MSRRQRNPVKLNPGLSRDYYGDLANDFSAATRQFYFSKRLV